jgi:ABC-type transport system substrate-binding protein
MVGQIYQYLIGQLSFFARYNSSTIIRSRSWFEEQAMDCGNEYLALTALTGNHKLPDKMPNPAATKNGTKTKTGEPITMNIATPNIPELINTANFLKTEFSKIGLAVNVDILSNEVLPETLKNRNFEILLFAFDLQSPADLYNFFNSDERKYPKLNISNYVNKNVDKLTNEIKETTVSNEREKEILNAIQTEIANDLPIIMLYTQNTVSVFLKNETKIILPKDLQNSEDKYKYLPYWYTETEKVFSFWNFKFLDKIEEWIY